MSVVLRVGNLILEQWIPKLSISQYHWFADWDRFMGPTSLGLIGPGLGQRIYISSKSGVVGTAGLGATIWELLM